MMGKGKGERRAVDAVSVSVAVMAMVTVAGSVVLGVEHQQPVQDMCC